MEFPVIKEIDRNDIKNTSLEGLVTTPSLHVIDGRDFEFDTPVAVDVHEAGVVVEPVGHDLVESVEFGHIGAVAHGPKKKVAPGVDAVGSDRPHSYPRARVVVRLGWHRYKLDLAFTPDRLEIEGVVSGIEDLIAGGGEDAVAARKKKSDIAPVAEHAVNPGHARTL